MQPPLAEEAIRNMLALKSVQIDCTSTVDGELAEHPESLKFILTIVGADHQRTGDLEYSDLIDHVRAILGEPTDQIYFHGEEYVRHPLTGEWLSEKVDRRRGGHIRVKGHVIESTVQEYSMVPAVEDKPAWDKGEVRLISFLFGSSIDLASEFATVGEEESDGRTIVHLRMENTPWPSGLRRKDAFDDEKLATLEPDLREAIESIRHTIPDSVRDLTELWIDRDMGLVQRFEETRESFIDGQISQRARLTRVFSRFNEAELPGPLPD